jgi:hypothetical protein
MHNAIEQCLTTKIHANHITEGLVICCGPVVKRAPRDGSSPIPYFVHSNQHLTLNTSGNIYG